MFDDANISADGPRGYTWAEWFEIVDLLSQIDYDCKFDCDGSCKTTRKNNTCLVRSGCTPLEHRGCCDDCANFQGYGIVMPPEAVATVEALFDKKLGFWHPDGCTLSPEYKSVICWVHNCDEEDDPIWQDIDWLARNWSPSDPVPTVEEVRTKLAARGMLRKQTLVMIS